MLDYPTILFKDQLRTNTEDAVHRGVLRAPTSFVEGAMF